MKMHREAKITILILSAAAISGAFRVIFDIVRYIDKEKFNIIVAHKPYFRHWAEESRKIEGAGAVIAPLRGSRLFDIRGFWDLHNIIRNKKVDILHCSDALGVPARIIGKALGSKVVERWGNPPPLIASQISRKHYHINYWTSFLVDGYIACSKEVLTRYIEQRPVILANKKRMYIDNCLDTENIRIAQEDCKLTRDRFGIREYETVLTNIGYFNEQKAQWDLLHAFSDIRRAHENVKLLLVGWGRLEKYLKDFAESLGISEFVVFTGKCSRTEVFEILSITDLFLLSSHWEGFGIVLTEAMAAGKPVVATNTDGAREVVEDGKTGILTPIGHPKIFAETVSALLNQPEQMADMGRRGRERVRRLFDCQRFIRGYEAFYQSVLHS